MKPKQNSSDENHSNENELGNQGATEQSASSFIRQAQVNSRIDDITELLEAVLSGIQALKFRHLIVIAFLFSLFLGYVAFNWILDVDNKSVLLNIAGRSRIVGVVDNCPVAKVPFGGETVHVVFVNYSTEDDSRYLASIIGKYDTAKIRPICQALHRDRDALKSIQPKTP